MPDAWCSRGRAVVCGGGLAGLLAACVLAEGGFAVTVVEPDPEGASAGPRPGAPQGHHAHGLFVRGVRVLEELLPGIVGELTARGAIAVDVGAQYVLASRFGCGASFVAGKHMLAAGQPLLEAAVRRRALARPGVTVLAGHRADHLTGYDGRVTGVVVREATGGACRLLEAELMVDATGRASRADRWLTALGYPAVRVSVVDAGFAFASRLYRPPARRPPWQVCHVMITPPLTRGGIIMPIEDDRWLVTLCGVGADRPTRGRHDFLPYARTLHQPELADALEEATELSGVTVTHAGANRRRHLDRLTPQPHNLILVGDAACCFNPLYAQGMTAAVLTARTLRGHLARHRSAEGFAPAFHRALAPLHDACWAQAATADALLAGTAAPGLTRRQRLLARHSQNVMAAGTRDPVAQEAFLDVVHMLCPPTTLLTPRVLARLVRLRFSPVAQRRATPR
ncbi:FAD-dependent monooxygenase [Streptomyces sp. NPDC046261]|uniref:FAD-dependent oxidoreductase n=1 Tax=Streptomyces sp. NPDC046261 TaxID=3157200 RepID=UPI00340DE37E